MATRLSPADEAPFNIQINGVAPGLIKSTQYIEDNWNTNTPEQKEATLKKIPAGRRGTSEEIAAGILFMASEEASYVTGHCLDIRIMSVLSCWSCSCVPASARSPAEPDHLLNTSVSARPAPERPNGIGTLPLLREGFWRPCP